MPYCANCGREVTDKTIYCPSCGHPQRSSAAVAPRGGTNGNAIASLVLGIAGFVVCPLVCSILAIVFGNKAKQELAIEPGQEGEGMANAGVVLGWIGIGFAVLGLIIFLAVAASMPPTSF